MGIPEAEIQDAPNFVKHDCACFLDKLETTLAAEIGNDIFFEALLEQKTTLGLESRKDAMKVPACMVSVLQAASAAGRTSHTVQSIVRAISACF
jgi:hypothetical protein